MFMYQLLFSKDKLKVLCDLSHVAVTCIDEEIARQQRRKCQEILREMPIDALFWVKEEVTRAQGGRAVFQENLSVLAPLTQHQETNNPSIPVKEPVATKPIDQPPPLPKPETKRIGKLVPSLGNKESANLRIQK